MIADSRMKTAAGREDTIARPQAKRTMQRGFGGNPQIRIGYHYSY